MRVDNVLLASSAVNFMGATVWNSGLNHTAGDTLSIANTTVFTGASALNAIGTAASTCNNWSSTGGTATMGLAGQALVSSAFASNPSMPCSSLGHVYCLQQ
jgi:hypothetical protein